MEKRMLQLKTERLLLKFYEECDREDMLSLLYNDEIRQTFMLPDFQTEQEAAAMWLRLKAWSLSDRHFEYGIYRQGRLIGFINDVEMDGDRIELGYVIHPDSKNRGYATEALAAAM
ncbi:MAG: GNAT family N-acetyltransferase, partial [bacterium]|nr:GNAT family N-acetyltransferase [bacterium]